MLGWWRDAGVDVLVDDAPRDWLAPPPARQPARPPADETPPQPHHEPVTALPDSLDGIIARYAKDPLFGPIDGRILPQGDPASGLMLLIDRPEPGDADAGHLLSGEIGRLFDAMLAAIGRDRASIYLAAITPARPAAGAVDPAAVEEWARIARRHVELAAPRAVLLIGEAPSRAILAAGHVAARGKSHLVNHADGSFAAIATIHPRLLLQHPARKADAWRDLRLLLGELSQ